MSHSYEFHEAANMFPLLSEVELRSLADDIEENGQKEPIELYDGKIIDGRNRYLACSLIQVEPEVCDVEELDDPVGYVVSKNLKRRQLKTSQRGMCAAKMAGLPRGTNRYTKVEGPMGPSTSLEEAGRMFGVSRKTVLRAFVVLQKGCQALINLCVSGDLAVRAGCEFAEALPNKKAQQKIASGGAATVRDYLASLDKSDDEQCGGCDADAVTLPDNPNEKDIIAVEAWLEQQDERPFMERFKVLWSCADEIGKAAIRAFVLDSE